MQVLVDLSCFGRSGHWAVHCAHVVLEVWLYWVVLMVLFFSSSFGSVWLVGLLIVRA